MKRSRQQPKHEELEEDDNLQQADVTVDSKPEAGGFGAALAKVLSRGVDAAKPVLSKRHTAMQKLVEAKEKESKDLGKVRKERKALRKAHNLDPLRAPPEFEKQLKKVATKGVVALFNAIAKHQHAVAEAERNAEKTSDKVRAVSAQQKSFLDLLKSGVGTDKAGAVPVKSIAATAPGKTTSSSGPAAKKGATWASEAYQPNKKGAAAADDDDDEEMDGGDILYSGSDDEY